MPTYYLVLIETSGNQAYVFQTNKRRENVGASEAIRQVGSESVCQVVKRITGRPISPQTLLSPDVNPSIFGSDSPVEVVYATSGKALCVVRDPDDGRRIVREVTLQARREAPGLDVHGAVGAWDPETMPAHKALSELHRCHGKVKRLLPSESGRFLRVPPVENCATSGFPAANHDPKDPGPDDDVFSRVALAKRSFIDDWDEQKKDLDPEKRLMSLREFEEHEERRMKWAAVIHADVNGMGKIFTKLHEYLGAEDGTTDPVKTYFKGLREFSIALDDCTKESFKKAVAACRTHKGKVALIPLVVAGDDMTVVCDGETAMDFTLKFLRTFTKTVEENGEGILAKVAQKAFDVKRFGIRAGIAFVKPHFPFYLAYKLAEELTESVKQATNEWYPAGEYGTPVPFAAFDFHVHHASSAPNLGTRKEHQVYNRPYVVTPIDDSFGASSDVVKKHQWNLLKQRIRALQASDEHDGNRRKISRSQLHALRAALMQGGDMAEATWRLIKERHPNVAAPFDDDFRTTLLDAMELVEFYKGTVSTTSESPTP